MCENYTRGNIIESGALDGLNVDVVLKLQETGRYVAYMPFET
jgi:hypothetical protein